MYHGYLNNFTRCLRKTSKVILYLGTAAVCLFAPATRAFPQIPSARFVVTVNPNTVSVGSEATLKIERRDTSGNPAPPGSDFKVKLTLTTLGSLEAAKRELSQAKLTPSQLAINQLAALPSEKESIQFTCIYPKGQKEIQLKVKSGRASRLYIFAESNGTFSGSTLLIVLKDSKPIPARHTRTAPSIRRTSFHHAVDSPFLIRASYSIPTAWRQSQPTITGARRGYELQFDTSGLDCARVEGKEWVSGFFVVLIEADTGVEAQAPREVQIDLEVTGGATVEPKTVLIKPMMARSQPIVVKLRDALSEGELFMSGVRYQGPDLIRLGKSHSYNLKPCYYATHLVLKPLATAALANGKDGFDVEVSAWYRKDNEEGCITAHHELLQHGRRISFKKDIGFKILDENKQERNYIVIPDDNHSKTVTLLGTLPKDFSISATSLNCLDQEIQGEAKVSFKWPWASFSLSMLGGLLCALLMAMPGHLVQKKTAGGLFNPVLRTHWLKFLWGVVIGLLLFCLLFYGAISSGSVKLFDREVDLVKLPFEFPLASLIIGFLGNLVFAGGISTLYRTLLSRSPGTESNQGGREGDLRQ
jgi:hypothetical protein